MKRIYFIPVLFALLIAACRKEKTDISAILPEDLSDIEIGMDAKIYFSDSADVKALIQTKELVRYLEKGKNKEDFRRWVLVEFFNTEGKVFSSLESKNGERYPLKNEVVVRDSVVFTNFENGNRLETEELRWNQIKREIHTERFVKLTTPTDTILSYGFRADENFTWYELRSIEGVRKIEGGR